MKDSLVAASAEFQGEIFFGFDELAVYEGIDTGEHLVSVLPSGVSITAGFFSIYPTPKIATCG